MNRRNHMVSQRRILNEFSARLKSKPCSVRMKLQEQLYSISMPVSVCCTRCESDICMGCQHQGSTHIFMLLMLMFELQPDFRLNNGALEDLQESMDAT